MEYCSYLLRKTVKSTIIVTVLIVVLWFTLYNLTDFTTISNYFGLGMAVCIFNTVMMNLKAGKFQKIIYIQSFWIIVAGFVLVLFHAGFETAAVLVAAATFASPFFGATIYEGVIGLTLLIILAIKIF